MTERIINLVDITAENVTRLPIFDRGTYIMFGYWKGGFACGYQDCPPRRTSYFMQCGWPENIATSTRTGGRLNNRSNIRASVASNPLPDWLMNGFFTGSGDWPEEPCPEGLMEQLLALAICRRCVQDPEGTNDLRPARAIIGGMTWPMHPEAARLAREADDTTCLTSDSTTVGTPLMWGVDAGAWARTGAGVMSDDIIERFVATRQYITPTSGMTITTTA